MKLDKLSLISAHYNQLVLRQRVIILLATIAVIYLLWVLLIDYNLSEKEEMLKKENQYLSSLMIEAHGNQNNLTGDENLIDIAPLVSRLDQIKIELNSLNADLKQYYGIGQSSNEVIAIIKDLVATSNELQLERVEILPVETIAVQINTAIQPNHTGDTLTQENASEELREEPREVLLNKHRILIELVGGYLDVADYLGRIEALSWGLFSQDVHYVVERHPLARTRLILYSLSLRGNAVDV